MGGREGSGSPSPPIVKNSTIFSHVFSHSYSIFSCFIDQNRHILHFPVMSAFAPSSEENNDAKRRKKEDAKSSSSRVLPSSLFFSFQNQEGNNNGIPSVDLSVATTSKQLELLINSLLSNTDSLPYAFYINNVEVISSLQETLQQLAESNEKISYEETVAVTYQPLSVFRVRPVTRCVETMPGHTDAVLIVSYRY